MADHAASASAVIPPADTDTDADETAVDYDLEQAADPVQDADPYVSPDERAQRSRLMSALRHPMTFGVIAVVAFAALVAWLGFQVYQSQEEQARNGQFLQAARQGALNLTTIDWQHAEDDVKRIMDTATGEFYDDFQQRSTPFVEVVKQAQSVSTGTVTEAALESHSDTEAQALVAVSVKTASTAGAEPVPRAWRMRISVQQLDGQMKISRVEFVP